MDERRKQERLPVDLRAECLDKDDRSRVCRIVDISREEAGLRVCLSSEAEPGQTITLRLSLPSREAPIIFKTDLRWARPLTDADPYTCVAGGELSAIDPADKRLLLEYAYNKWFKQV